ncbi:hypothetical protein Glove_66g106 [Diversispora epigaea]|uniref:CR-type domain-containing protein n=1 Tax=Diversispora epigaea TaxID=1348612 RepID=A0A397JJU9_9GLOM|nr:hypothetical protein Glove_66g106 [Diversispora epigaea]
MDKMGNNDMHIKLFIDRQYKPEYIKLHAEYVKMILVLGICSWNRPNFHGFNLFGQKKRQSQMRSSIMTEMTKCDNCKGRGKIKCRHCSGDGYLCNHKNQMVTCNRCKGKGGKECPICYGEGEMENT